MFKKYFNLLSNIITIAAPIVLLFLNKDYFVYTNCKEPKKLRGVKSVNILTQSWDVLVDVPVNEVVWKSVEFYNICKFKLDII